MTESEQLVLSVRSWHLAVGFRPKLSECRILGFKSVKATARLMGCCAKTVLQSDKLSNNQVSPTGVFAVCFLRVHHAAGYLNR